MQGSPRSLWEWTGWQGNKLLNYCNRCFHFFFFGHCLFWTFYDYSVGQLDVVWGDLVQKLCQICRKSESSVMSACEWSSESEPRRFVGAPSKSDPFDPKRTADSQAETEDPFAKAHGFWSIFWGGQKFTKWAGQSRLVWIPWCHGLRVEIVGRWKLVGTCWSYGAPVLHLFSIFFRCFWMEPAMMKAMQSIKTRHAELL